MRLSWPDERQRQAARRRRQQRQRQPLDEEPAHLGRHPAGAGDVRDDVRRPHQHGGRQHRRLFEVPRSGRRGHREGCRDQPRRHHRHLFQRRQVPDLSDPGPDAGPAPARKERDDRGQARRGYVDVDAAALSVAAVPAVPRHRLLRAQADAEEHRRRCDGLRQEPRAHADAEGRQGHLRRRRRHRRSAVGTDRDRRLPQGPDQVRPSRRQDPQGRVAGRVARHRQDPARPRDRG